MRRKSVIDRDRRSNTGRMGSGGKEVRENAALITNGRSPIIISNDDYRTSHVALFAEGDWLEKQPWFMDKCICKCKWTRYL